MPSLRIELNHDGIRELLNSQGVRDDLDRRIKRVAAAAAKSSNLPVTSDVYFGGSRARAYARYDAPPGEGIAHEAKTGDLARALSEAGGA